MKGLNRGHWLASLGLLAAASAVQAAPPLSTGNPLVELHRQFSLGAGSTFQHYAEHQAGMTPDAENGWMPNIQASGSWMFNRTILGSLHHPFISVGTQYSTGDTRYKGIYQTTGPILVVPSNSMYTSFLPRLKSTTTNKIVNVNLKVGNGFIIDPKLMITPYLTYGHRYWERDLNGVGSYNEYYNTNYVGGGVMVDFRLTPRLTLGADAMGAATFANTLSTSGQLQVPGGFDLGNAPMVRVTASADYRVKRHWHFYAQAQYIAFTYGHSSARPTYIETSTSFGPPPPQGQPLPPGVLYKSPFNYYEPDSTTRNVSLDAGIRYTF